MVGGTSYSKLIHLQKELSTVQYTDAAVYECILTTAKDSPAKYKSSYSDQKEITVLRKYPLKDLSNQ